MSDRLLAIGISVRELAERRPLLVCAALGLVTALGFPPLHAWWSALPALAPVIVIVYRAPDARSAALRGYFFGWAHLTLSNNWIATAFTHQAKMPEVLGWVAVPLLCVYLAIYPALAAFAASWLARRRSFMAFVCVFAGCWIIAEWVRSWAFTGYPWPPLALMLLGAWDRPGLAALLPWLGTYALSGLAILLAGMLAALVVGGPARGLTRTLTVIGFAGLFIAGPMLAPGPPAEPGQRPYRLVQPLIPQDEINDGSKFEEQFARLSRLSASSPDDPPLVLWPESAIPDYLEDGYPARFYRRMTAGADPVFARRRIAAVIGPGARLLTGVVNLDIETRAGEARAVSARNSVVAIDDQGRITHSYAKAHLVPYGEYLPLRAVLEPLGLSRLVAGTIDYRPGPGPRTIDLGKHGLAGIQICYEIVFSGEVVDPQTRPDFIFNPSNDGWFGAWGPPQHLGQARLRAIEEGLPVLRSTTTGISAVIDSRGIVRGSIALGKADALAGMIPPARPATPFARMGNMLTLGWAIGLIALGLALSRLLALRSLPG